MARKLNDWITEYISYTGPSEAPTLTHVWTAVSTIAGALRRKVWIDMGFFEWTPCFYIIIVGKAGVVNKSTTVNIGMDMLKELNINFGPSSITWQALVSDLAQSAEGVDIYDNGIIDTFSSVTISASELGTLIDPKNRELVDVLVDLWDGRRTVWEKKTKTSGNDAIQNPWINIIAATTPSWLSENMPESMIGGGFTSRCVFVYGNEKRCLDAYPFRNMPKDAAAKREMLLADLEHISMLKGPYTIAEDAIEWGTQWYEELHTKTQLKYAHLNDERFEGYKARKQTHMHKLAIVLSASRRDERIITKEDLVAADEILTATERISLAPVFNNIGKADSGRLLDRMLRIITSHGGRATKATIIGELLRISEPRAINDMIIGAVASNIIRQLQHGAVTYLELIHAAPETPASH